MTTRYAKPLRDMPYMSTTKQRAHKVGINARDLGNLAIGAAVLAGLVVLNPLLAVWDVLRPNQGAWFMPSGSHRTREG